MYKKLYKTRYNNKLDGVCGGIAIYCNMDPTLVRLIWVLVTIMTGIVPGVIGYFICAVIMPREPEGYDYPSSHNPNNSI
ncbi:MAG: PspC domain-containing protein [Clostridiales bacterium]|jgi:phage shock protein C|nr:PspC domain-containing protein [Clostridiales bacterium]